MFNKETEYAMRSLVYIQVENYKGRRPGISEIAAEIDAPRFFTAKILQRMVRQGFVQSRKGRGGGFYFDSKHAPLKIGDVIKAVEGDNIMTGCAFGLKYCDETNPCPLHFRYAPIREKINTLVAEETIQSLARRPAGTD
ncbi:MAG: Rrf2 family transcriptional regulator [Bacteroidales bacterium]|jgi:Rrf2 family protein|nr:Rrf2 family transcriptional regulator [Bacteroidales bacterium]